MQSILDVHWDSMDLLTPVVNKTLHNILEMQELHRNKKINRHINQTVVRIYFQALMEVVGELMVTHQALQEYQGII